jgi:hypothetical protein
MTIDEFIDTHGLTMTAVQVPARTDALSHETWDLGATHWMCIIIRPGLASMVVEYTMGSAYTDPPKLRDVLSCVASEVTSVRCEPDFESWADSYGYETDSIKAVRVYKSIKRQSRDLVRLLNKDLVRVLCEEVEQL